MEETFFECKVCKDQLFCNICRDLVKGKGWRTFQLSRFPSLKVESFECPIHPWGFINLPSEQPPIPLPIQPPIPEMSSEKWLELKEVFLKNNDETGSIQWKVLERNEHNPNKYGCQCRKWKQELLDYAIRQGYLTP